MYVCVYTHTCVCARTHTHTHTLSLSLTHTHIIIDILLASATASTRNMISRNPCPICGLACVSMHVAMRAVAQARRGLGASACVCFTVGETALTCEEFPVPLESVSHGSVAEAAPAPLGV